MIKALNMLLMVMIIGMFVEKVWEKEEEKIQLKFILAEIQYLEKEDDAWFFSKISLKNSNHLKRKCVQLRKNNNERFFSLVTLKKGSNK